LGKVVRSSAAREPLAVGRGERGGSFKKGGLKREVKKGVLKKDLSHFGSGRRMIS
jgi:hypothetical protein